MNIYVVILLAVIFSWILFALFYKPGPKAGGSFQPATDEQGKAAQPLRLQAYERLVLLAERISLPGLISRIGPLDVSAKEMQLLLLQTIRQEFDHNVSQQIYVSAEAWDAVRNLKEQNMLVINQVASFLPEEASASQLNKSLLDLLIQSPKASLHNLVSEALSYEAKQWM